MTDIEGLPFDRNGYWTEFDEDCRKALIQSAKVSDVTKERPKTGQRPVANIEPIPLSDREDFLQVKGQVAVLDD